MFPTSGYFTIEISRQAFEGQHLLMNLHRPAVSFAASESFLVQAARGRFAGDSCGGNSLPQDGPNRFAAQSRWGGAQRPRRTLSGLRSARGKTGSAATVGATFHL